MAGLYRPRHPERTVLYRVMFHHFERFLAGYEGRFEREYGFLRPIIREVAERYLDCGNPRCGFARLRCPDCHEERLVMFSCRSRGFCPSCHAKRVEEWAERILSWRHSGFSVHSRVRAKTKTEAERVGKYMIRPLMALERFSFLEQEGKVAYRYGQAARETETMDYLEFIARVTSHIPDKGQVMVRYYGLYANAHRGKVKKASLEAAPLRIVEEEMRRIPSKGWAA
ncbi:MAG: transposase [Candidatus Aminicenantes bacterium]|nr:transposase [Candidatus Aminicenantes bacterium]